MATTTSGVADVLTSCAAALNTCGARLSLDFQAATDHEDIFRARVPREKTLFSTCETSRALELVSRCIELKIDTFNPRVFRRQISLIAFKNKRRFGISNGNARKSVSFEDETEERRSVEVTRSHE